MPKRAKPIGQPTRGKTALNRLRQVDNFTCLAWGHVLSSSSPLIVDVGYGEYAWTALEMYHRLLHINPSIRLLGIEIDPQRVMNALPHADPPHIDFRLGGFNLVDVLDGQQATLIRAYNVLRQYDET
ncbi:MAG: class I SAM-dependent methyltransferase, partial [Anaerolineae bacterium]|nr:class I SAM-dependent methyltransferase [Anaerolineae bacterium]